MKLLFLVSVSLTKFPHEAWFTKIRRKKCFYRIKKFYYFNNSFFTISVQHFNNFILNLVLVQTKETKSFLGFYPKGLVYLWTLFSKGSNYGKSSVFLYYFFMVSSFKYYRVFNLRRFWTPF